MQCIHLSRNLCSLTQLSHGNFKIDFPKPNSNILGEKKNPKPNQKKPQNKTQTTKPPTRWNQNNTRMESDSFRLERTAGGRSLKELMDRLLLKEGTVMQKSMIRFIHLIACGCAMKHKIHLLYTNTGIQDPWTLPQVLWKKGTGRDEPVQDTGCKEQLRRGMGGTCTGGNTLLWSP